MKIGVLKGNGIGPEIMAATQRVLEATGLPLEWVDVPIAEEAIARCGHPLPCSTIAALRQLRVAIKGPLIVDKLRGRLTCVREDGTSNTWPSLNNALRRELGLFVCPRPLRGVPGLSGRYAELDIIVMREITEGIYAGQEVAVRDGVAEATKRITRSASLRVARFAFEYARHNGRRRVSCIHKANVLNLTDGLFLRCFQEVADEYRDIAADDYMIDAAAYLLVKSPERFDVLVTDNQYGDILSDLGAGLVGSLGLAPGANFGDDMAVFEACHGAAPDIAGKGIANPVALILSGSMTLRHLGYREQAARVERAVWSVLGQRRILTPDLGGKATTMALAEAIATRVQAGEDIGLRPPAFSAGA